jgi:hypothetical protein
MGTARRQPAAGPEIAIVANENESRLEWLNKLATRRNGKDSSEPVEG